MDIDTYTIVLQFFAHYLNISLMMGSQLGQCLHAPPSSLTVCNTYWQQEATLVV